VSKHDQYRGFKLREEHVGTVRHQSASHILIVAQTCGFPVAALGDELQQESSPVDGYESLFDGHLKIAFRREEYGDLEGGT
jgi:hypothetical protein